MTCDRLNDVLGTYLDDELDAATRALADAHLSGCLRCAALVRDLERIRREAAALPEFEPSRDLWPAIAERIEAPVIQLAPRESVRAHVRRPVRLGIAAALLVAVSAGVTYRLTRSADQSTSSPLAATPVTGTDKAPTLVAGRGEDTSAPSRAAVRAPAPAASGAQASVQTVRRTPQPASVTYDQAINGLRGILDIRRQDLDPATVAVLENSLTTIDRAISDARAALARDPASGFLVEQLNNALAKKVGLLRTVALLPPRA